MFSKALLAGAFAAFTAAQSTVLTFTHVPNPVTDGEAQALTFATNDTTSPVTIILRKGASNDLQTVSTLTTSATDGQYIWTPSTSLADGDDYALEIKQGTQLNYFGPFAVQGQSATTSSSSSTAASTSGYAAATTGAGNSTAIAYTSATANGTTTTVAPVVPVSAGSLSAGTGTALPRNTTMSMATLTSGASATMTGTQTGTMSGASNTAADTSAAGFQTATSSASSSAASSTSSGASDLKVNGALAMVFSAIAAALFLY